MDRCSGGRRATRWTFALPSSGRALSVEAFVPNGVSDATKLLFVLHGVNRDAREYAESWIPFAAARNYVVVAPHFTQDDFPGGAGYNQGGVMDQNGRVSPQASWAFQMIENLFDLVRDRLGLAVSEYEIYGHSAGAQFVHRLVLLLPRARVSLAVAANAGWYTLPSFSADYPYGLGGLPVSTDQARRVLQRKLVVLLGECDTDTEDPFLRRTEEALQQGTTRLERGLTFVRSAREAAAELGVDLGWDLVRVPGIGHVFEDMVAPAAEVLAQHARPSARRKASG